MSKDAVDTLVTLAKYNGNHEVRLEAIKSLGQYCNEPDAVGVLTSLSKYNGNHEIRIAAIKALGGGFDPDRTDNN